MPHTPPTPSPFTHASHSPTPSLLTHAHTSTTSYMPHTPHTLPTNTSLHPPTPSPSTHASPRIVLTQAYLYVSSNSNCIVEKVWSHHVISTANLIGHFLLTPVTQRIELLNRAFILFCLLLERLLNNIHMQQNLQQLTVTVQSEVNFQSHHTCTSNQFFLIARDVPCSNIQLSISDPEWRQLKLKYAWQLTPCYYRSSMAGCPQAWKTGRGLGTRL